MNKFKKLLCGCLGVCLAFVPVVSAVPASAESITSLQQQLEELESKNKEYQEILDKTQADIKDKEEYVETLVDKIDVLDQKIALTNESIEELNSSIAEKQAAIDEAESEIDEQVATLCTRLKTIYMSGSASDLEIILGAKSFDDFIDKVQLVKVLSNYDKGLIDEINVTLDEVSERKEALEADKSELEEQKSSLQDDEDDLNTLVEENQALLDELYKTNDETKDAMEQSTLESEEIESQIISYYQQIASSSTGSSSDIKISKSGFTWPCPSSYTITSLWNEDRTTYNHGAIDIGANTGSTVVAACEGTVIAVNNSCAHNWGKSSSCGCGGGYGNYVMIYHDGGKMTIYGHLTYAGVEVGDTVKTGQTIGVVGSTGNSTGPHLHFECRLNGVKYNPMLEFED
jgi:murein DD-endopeptidase MepM/ murein hydrolase activator NlpD